jgi:Concanavalin A-like lectin/glucanases superfamily
VQFVANGAVAAGPQGQVDVDAWDVGVGSLTVAFWYRDLTPTGLEGTLVRKSSIWNMNGWLIAETANGGVSCRLHHEPSVHATTPSRVLDGSWHHVACVVSRSDASLKVYIDGEVRANVSIEILAGANLDSPYGLWTNLYGRLGGQLDELGIWSRALDAAEIDSLASSR